MKLVDSLLNFLRMRKSSGALKAPEGFCPNCWGLQEYGGQFFEAIKNENVDLNDKNSKVGWVQDYANKHLYKIVLKKEDEMLVCSKCKLTFKPT